MGWVPTLSRSFICRCRDPQSPNKPVRNPLLSCDAAICGKGAWMKKRVTIAAAFAGIGLMTHPAAAQDPVSLKTPAVASDQADDDIKLFRKDVRSLKKQIISANIELTDEEAQQFWPIYDRYTAEMVKIMDKKFELLKEYARNYDTITDEQADAYIQGRAAVEQSILQLRIKYMPMFRKVLSGKTAALFTQMDWRLGLVVDLQLASQIPMIEP
jgi:Spy/CpxP family protein refolding chaperone